MKIGEITHKDDIQRSQSTSADKEAAKTDDFRSMFEGELNALAGAAEPSMGTEEAFRAVGAGTDISAVWKADTVWADIQAAEGAARTAGEKLDTMCRLACDGPTDLKRIDEMLGALSREAVDLEARVKDLPRDHPLRSVSDELSVLAYVESVKWQRGDYL